MTQDKLKLRDVSFQGYIVRFFQVINALASFLIAAILIGIDDSNYAYALVLFTGLWTLAVLLYFTLAVHHYQKIYSFVAILVLEFTNIAFWAASTGCLASQFPKKHALDGSPTNYSVVTVLLIIMLIFSCIMFCLHVTTMIMLVIRDVRYGPSGEVPLPHVHHKEHHELHSDEEAAHPPGTAVTTG